ncbi:PAS domain-containing protein [Adhaeribacter arboris]|nr:PAS domain-containing protein [Adhaeribacter arboris]
MENLNLHYLEIVAKSTNQVVFAYQLADNQFTLLNQAFEKVWSRNRKSVMKNPASLWKTIHPEDKSHLKQTFQDLREGALVNDIEFRIQTPKQPERWICLRPILLDDEQVIIGQAEDVTAVKKYNDY